MDKAIPPLAGTSGPAPGFYDRRARKPLKIGLSPRILNEVPVELGFKNRKLQYLEQSMAHWLLGSGALVFMLPTVVARGELTPDDIDIADYVDALDGLVLQGGVDICPVSYGESNRHADPKCDAVRDNFELGLLRGFISQQKPVLGICRGMQLINVACGGSLMQDIGVELAACTSHNSAELYDHNVHDVRFQPGSLLEQLYREEPQRGVVSIHHQAVKTLGSRLDVEAISPCDGIVEAIRLQGPAWVVGVQWHPEYHDQCCEGVMPAAPLLDAFLDAARARRNAIWPKHEDAPLREPAHT